MYIYIYISNDPRDTQELGLGLANWWSAVTFTQTRLPRRFNLLRSSKESFMLAPLGSPPTSDDRIASNSCHGTRKERKEREDSICESRWAIPLLPPSPLKKVSRELCGIECGKRNRPIPSNRVWVDTASNSTRLCVSPFDRAS